MSGSFALVGGAVLRRFGAEHDAVLAHMWRSRSRI